MPIDIDAAQQGKNERQRRESKDLKVDPDILRQPEGDINVSQTARNKNSAHARFSFDQTCCGNASSLPNIRWINGFFITHWLINSAPANSA